MKSKELLFISLAENKIDNKKWEGMGVNRKHRIEIPV